MTCQHCIDSERTFDRARAREDLKAYRKNGPDKTTRMLIDALASSGLEGKRVLDIGAGVGAIHHELLADGAPQAIVVEASRSYIEAAEQEAERRGHRDRVEYVFGDFVKMAERVPQSDLVALDRVICCYPHVRELLGRALERAGEQIGLVYPQDRWWSRVFARVFNLFFVIQRSAFRVYIHRQSLIDGLLGRHGFRPIFERDNFFWRIAVYRRQ